MATNFDAMDLGNILGSGLQNANSYKQDFIDSEVASDLNLASIETVNLTTTTIICKQLIGSHFTLDHPVNCNLDSPNLYLDTGLGARICPYILFDDELNYYFSEPFTSTTYAVAGTAYWDTTNSRLSMSSLATHLPKVTYYDIGSFTIDGVTNISTIRVGATETKWNSTDSIVYLVSFDNRITWTQLVVGVDTDFVTSGTTGYLRVVFTGTGNKDTYIDDLFAVYS